MSNKPNKQPKWGFFIGIFFFIAIMNGLNNSGLDFNAVPVIITIAVVGLFINMFFNLTKKPAESEPGSENDEDSEPQENEPPTDNNPAWNPPPESAPQGSSPTADEQKLTALPFRIGSSLLCHEFEESFSLSGENIEGIKDKIGSPLYLVSEIDENRGKSDAAIYLDGARIGYAARSHIQEMVSGWAARGEKVSAFLSSVYASGIKAYYKIGFYEKAQNLTQKRFPIEKANKKAADGTKRTVYLHSSIKGTQLNLKYDNILERYVVFNDLGEEIGELPSKARKFTESAGNSKILAVLDGVGDLGSPQRTFEAVIYIVK